MTYQSTWRQTMGAAKLGLGAAVVAGVMAVSAPAQAVTVSTNLVLDNSVLFKMGDTHNVSVQCLGEDTCQAPGSITSLTYGLEADVSLRAPTYVKVLFTGDHVKNLLVEWSTDQAGNDPIAGTQLNFDGMVTLAMIGGETYWLQIAWDSIASGKSFQVGIEAIPLPAGLVLFLSGLVGIGFLGRYKAKRREPAVA